MPASMERIKSKIKVGLLVDELSMPAWVVRMLDLIVHESRAEIALVVRNACGDVSKDTGREHAGDVGGLLFSAWRRLDKRLSGVRRDAFGIVDVSAMLNSVSKIDVCPEHIGSFDYLRKEDLDEISGYDITVFLQLGFRTLRGGILDAAPCGIWTLRYGADPVGQSDLGGVLEVLRGSPTTSSTLLMSNGEFEDGRVLYQSWSTTDPFSIHRNLNNCYWKTVSFVPRMLRELSLIGSQKFWIKYAQTDVGRIPFDEPPSTPAKTRASSLLVPLLGKIVSRAVWRSHSIEQWMLLYDFHPPGTPPNAVSNLSRFRQLVPPKDRFWADPCVVERHGRHTIFIEEQEYAKPFGHLSVIELDEDGNPILPAVKILERPYHLSYPFVFEDGGELYMIPETQQNGTIELYHCSRFPDRWEFVMNLMENVRAVDTTVWRHAGRYWLFVGMAESDGASLSEELYLYFSDRLLTTDWQPHPCNPIVSDTRCARPAGRIFQSDGHWYRPAQDCSSRYGRAITIQKIESISDRSYKEIFASRIEPTWDKDILRTHTLSRTERLVCIDGLMRRSRFRD
jgi:hypothetical protein